MFSKQIENRIPEITWFLQKKKNKNKEMNKQNPPQKPQLSQHVGTCSKMVNHMYQEFFKCNQIYQVKDDVYRTGCLKKNAAWGGGEMQLTKNITSMQR